MVSISKEGGGTDGRPSRSAVLSFLECSKPAAYIFFGLLVGTMIMNSNQEEKLLRGSSFFAFKSELFVALLMHKPS